MLYKIKFVDIGIICTSLTKTIYTEIGFHIDFAKEYRTPYDKRVDIIEFLSRQNRGHDKIGKPTYQY